MQRKTILCYRRKSVVVRQSDLVSPEHQTAAVEASITILGPNFRPEWYEDVEGHKSGRTEEGRPGWLRLKSRLFDPDVAGVACYSLSRIYRNVREFLDFVEELNKRDLRLIVVKEQIDTGTAVGIAVNTIMMTMYQLESDLASERMTETIRYKRTDKSQHWGTVPFGVIRGDDQRLEPDVETVERLLRLYQLFASGEYTYDKLCAQMNQEGLPYRGRNGEDRDWTRDDVRRTLTLWRLYSGSITIGSNRDDSDQVRVIRDAHDPILPPKLCHEVADQLDVRRKRHSRRSTSQHMLSGLLYCGYCGQILGSTTARGTRRYRHSGTKGSCPEKWVDAEEIEQAIVSKVAGLWTPGLERRIEQRLNAVTASTPDIQALRGKITKREDQLNRIIHIYLDNHMSHVDYHRRSQEIEREINDLQDQLHGSEITDIESAAVRLPAICADLEALSMSEQRERLLATFERIDVRNGMAEKFIPQPWLASIWDVVPGSAETPKENEEEPEQAAIDPYDFMISIVSDNPIRPYQIDSVEAERAWERLMASFGTLKDS